MYHDAMHGTKCIQSDGSYYVMSTIERNAATERTAAKWTETLGKNLVKSVELRINPGWTCDKCFYLFRECPAVCNRDIVRAVPSPAKVRAVIEQRGIPINTETAELVIDGNEAYSAYTIELEELRRSLWEEIGDEDEGLYSLLQRDHDVTDNMHIGICDSTEFNKNNGTLVDRVDSEWLDLWKASTADLDYQDQAHG